MNADKENHNNIYSKREVVMDPSALLTSNSKEQLAFDNSFALADIEQEEAEADKGAAPAARSSSRHLHHQHQLYQQQAGVTNSRTPHLAPSRGGEIAVQSSQPLHSYQSSSSSSLIQQQKPNVAYPGRVVFNQTPADAALSAFAAVAAVPSSNNNSKQQYAGDGRISLTPSTLESNNNNISNIPPYAFDTVASYITPSHTGASEFSSSGTGDATAPRSRSRRRSDRYNPQVKRLQDVATEYVAANPTLSPPAAGTLLIGGPGINIYNNKPQLPPRYQHSTSVIDIIDSNSNSARSSNHSFSPPPPAVVNVMPSSEQTIPPPPQQMPLQPPPPRSPSTSSTDGSTSISVEDEHATYSSNKSSNGSDRTPRVSRRNITGAAVVHAATNKVDAADPSEPLPHQLSAPNISSSRRLSSTTSSARQRAKHLLHNLSIPDSMIPLSAVSPSSIPPSATPSPAFGEQTALTPAPHHHHNTNINESHSHQQQQHSPSPSSSPLPQSSKYVKFTDVFDPSHSPSPNTTADNNGNGVVTTPRSNKTHNFSGSHPTSLNKSKSIPVTTASSIGDAAAVAVPVYEAVQIQDMYRQLSGTGGHHNGNGGPYRMSRDEKLAIQRADAAVQNHISVDFPEHQTLGVASYGVTSPDFSNANEAASNSGRRSAAGGNVTPVSIANGGTLDSNNHQHMRSRSNSGSSSSSASLTTELQFLRTHRELLKTLVAIIFLLIGWLCTISALAYSHDRIPMTEPLPDLIFSIVPIQAWALKYSEYIIVVGLVSVIVMVITHKYRWVVLRRICVIVGLLYMGRSVTMLVTGLPPPDINYPCEEQLKHTAGGVVIKRILQFLVGGGMSFRGYYTLCGDYIYSGHTCVIVVFYLLLREYAPRKLFVLTVGYGILGVLGIVLVSISRGHYTVDIVIAYWVTTRTFWIYHSLASNPTLKNRSNTNYLSRVWWFPIFHYLEGNVPASKLPNHFEWPLPWPRSWANRR